MGGAVSANEQGFQMREIGESAYRQQLEVDSGQRVVVGVNQFVTDTPPMGHLLRVNAEAAQQQVDRLQELRQLRVGALVQTSLARLVQVARGDENTVPAILECVEGYCTLGEICQVFRNVFGEQPPMGEI
jgi:methylmalonyl-CoA mutase N-terminal domain/subunit